MPVTVRLDESLEKKLERVSRQALTTKSEIIKTGLRHYLTLLEEQNSPYLLGRDLFGKSGSSVTDLSVNKQHLKRKIRAKCHR